MLMGKGSEIKKPQITQDSGSHLKKTLPLHPKKTPIWT